MSGENRIKSVSRDGSVPDINGSKIEGTEKKLSGEIRISANFGGHASAKITDSSGKNHRSTSLNLGGSKNDMRESLIFYIN
jgi:hypothetical protein